MCEMDRPFDDGYGNRLHGVLHETTWCRPDGIKDIGSRSQVAGDNGTQIVDEDVVILDTSFPVRVDAIQDLDDRTDGHDEPGLLEHLALDGGGQRFAHVNGAAWHAPL